VVRSEFDADPLLLGLPNGVLDLRDGSFRSAQRKDMITKLAGAEYDVDATCPTWDRFLFGIVQR
jgi:putative DNA primase/helicase